MNQTIFHRGELKPINEKRIFGVLTRDQVGYVPKIKVNFTENEETFCQDTYVFKSLVEQSKDSEAAVQVDFNDELYKEQVVNEYKRNPQQDERDNTVNNICTV